MTPKCPDCKLDQEDCICFGSEHQKQTIERQAAQIEMMREFIARAPVSSGVCCCGEAIDGHSSPMSCGHNPIDLWDHSVEQILSTTPDQALEQFAAKVREQCAKICETQNEIGAAIRAAKVREERSGLKPPKGYSAEELEKDNPFNQWMRED